MSRKSSVNHLLSYFHNNPSEVDYTSWTPEVGRKRSVSWWSCKNKRHNLTVEKSRSTRNNSHKGNNMRGTLIIVCTVLEYLDDMFNRGFLWKVDKQSEQLTLHCIHSCSLTLRQNPSQTYHSVAWNVSYKDIPSWLLSHQPYWRYTSLPPTLSCPLSEKKEILLTDRISDKLKILTLPDKMNSLTVKLISSTSYRDLSVCDFSVFLWPVHVWFSKNCTWYNSTFPYSRDLSVCEDSRLQNGRFWKGSDVMWERRSGYSVKSVELTVCQLFTGKPD